MTKKNIRLINCGGTIGAMLSHGVIRGGLVTNFSQLDGRVDRVVSPFSVLSENMDLGYLEKLEACLREQMNTSDNIIITHGTDTLAHTAAYLGLRFAGIGKKIMLVSSNFPLSDARANGEKNLTQAVKFIDESEICGVFATYLNKRGEKTRVHYGTRLLEPRAFDGAVFSGNNKYCDWENMKKDSRADNSASEISRFVWGEKRLTHNVIFLKAHPLTDWKDLRNRSTERDIFVVEGSHSGTVKTQGENTIRELEGRRVYLAGGKTCAKYESTLFLPSFITALDNICPIALYYKVFFAYAYFAENERENYIKTCTAHEFFPL